MPELPELEVVREVLQRRVIGRRIEAVEVSPTGGPLIVRDLTRDGLERALTGATFTEVKRRGKFLLFAVAPHPPAEPLYLVINLKLTGRLQLAAATEKRLPKTHVVFTLSGADDLRYVDRKSMGQMYLTRAIDRVPDYGNLGPEPLGVSLATFRERLRAFRGELKGILTRGEFIAGIGNAYADEILWTARLHPYRKRTQLASDEVDRLYQAVQTTLLDAIEKVRAEMGEQIHLEPRDFMSVHMKTGEPCPRCGAPISLVGANQRLTNFCRACQPGGLIKGM